MARFVFIVPNVVVQTHLLVFRGTTVKARHLIVPGFVFAACLEQQHFVSCFRFRKARGKWTTTGARADYYVIEFWIAHIRFLRSTSWDCRC